jgi:16S rRNA G966 N2-methylase RsmD
VSDCCGPEGYGTTFGDKFARRSLRRYRRRGLNPTQQRLVGFLEERGLERASVLEIGGGVGEIQVELLRRGASHVTNLEISTGYEREAAQLLESSGMSGRVTRRLLDIATSPDKVEPADVVVLHRVVCCYADYERLLTASGSHAQRLLVFTHPPPDVLNRASFWWDNFVRRLRRNDFRSFVHPPDAMIAVLRAQGLVPRYHHRGLSWEIVGLDRQAV